jgi:hypothetical protein
VQAPLVVIDEHAGRDVHCRNEGQHITHAAFVPLTPGTIVDLERVLRNYNEWEE